MPKRAYPWLESYAERFGLKKTSRDVSTTRVDSASCCFCETFGRESQTDNDRQRSKTRAIQIFKKDSFNPSNIAKHMIEQHPTKWKLYVETRNRKDVDPESFHDFFKQMKLEAFFRETSEVKAKRGRLYPIDKDIVEVVVKELLIDDQEKLDGDKAMHAFEPVRNELGDVVSYTVFVKNVAQFNHVVELVSASITFRQIAKVVRSDCENLNAAATVGTVAQGEASNITRVNCAIGIQSLSSIMKKCWAFSIAVDEATQDGQNAHLDVRIKLPPVLGFKNGPEVENGFHLMAVPLHALTHSGETYANLLIKMLDSLCPDWRVKLLGSSTDGAGNMTGHFAGFSTLLRNQSLCPEAFYRIWCLAHQLDLLTKSAIDKLDEASLFHFMKTMTNVIGYLRRQKTLIAEMNNKCPYYIETRWKSLANVTSWLLTNRVKICLYMNNKPQNPTAKWWLLVQVAHKFLTPVMEIFDRLQKNNGHLSQQLDNLKYLQGQLIDLCGADLDESEEYDEMNSCTTMGPYQLSFEKAKECLMSMGVTALECYEGLSIQEQRMAVNCARVLFLSAVNGLSRIKAERNQYDKEFETVPAYTPLDLVNVPPVDFIRVVQKHKRRLRNSFDEATLLNVTDEHQGLIRAVKREPALLTALKRCQGRCFNTTWRPLGERFSSLRLFASGLASLMPTTAQVESDFSYINYRMDEFNSRLSDFALEGILYARQKKALENLIKVI